MKEFNIPVADIKKAAKKAKTKAMIAEGIIKNYESTFYALTSDEEALDAEEILSGVKTLDEAIGNLYWAAEYLKWIRMEIKCGAKELEREDISEPCEHNVKLLSVLRIKGFEPGK